VLWPLLADTPRLNQAIGLPPIDYTITPLATGGSHIEASIKVSGVTLARWVERPFLWREPYGYMANREFIGGPFASCTVGVELTAGAETEVLSYAEFQPRNKLGSAILLAGLGQRSVDKVIEQCRIFERYVEGKVRSPYPGLPRKRSALSRVEVLGQQLSTSAADERLVARLLEHVAGGRDDELIKMRPFDLADRWGADRRSVLALFLHATVAGLVTMSWDVLCPNCRVGKSGFAALRELEAQAHCQTCNISFDAEFDRLVEVRFSVAPAIRAVQDREFCIGGPMNTPHVVAQIPLGPGEVREIACQLKAGSYRARSPHAAVGPVFEVADAAPAGPLELTVTAAGIVCGNRGVQAGEARVVLQNDTDYDTAVAIEGYGWPDTVATAATVSTLPEFRDLFSSEVLAPGLQLGIRRLAFMFTDLTGSTALYQRVGQARAFRIVQEQFVVLLAAIEAHRGTVVKTIGDAVMATFETGADGLAAAVEIQRTIRALDLGDAADPARLVRVGLHQGPCVAVTLNGVLDYFGTTVNIASRVEHEAEGGDIVATVELCDPDDAKAVLSESGASLSPGVVRLRGIREPVQVVRIRVP